MPLSEDEQRILDQIESQLYETDPGLVRGIADTTVYSLARRRLLLAVGGLLVGFALLLGTLQTEGIGFLLAFGGFVIMVLAAMSIEANLRRLGKAGIDQLALDEQLRPARLLRRSSPASRRSRGRRRARRRRARPLNPRRRR
ncbi:MAG: DUF3040 domain-containing protein [Acidimicrobiales bacterium]